MLNCSVCSFDRWGRIEEHIQLIQHKYLAHNIALLLLLLSVIHLVLYIGMDIIWIYRVDILVWDYKAIFVCVEREKESDCA